MRLAWPHGPLLLLALAIGTAVRAAGTPVDEQARSVVHMLDYVSVDYPDFVKDGRVVDAAEYAEQLEFAGQVVALLEQMPATPDGAALIAEARALQAQVAAKADGAAVSAQANALRTKVIAAYRLVVAPRQAPDPQQGAALFMANCMSCHGPRGEGDGPQAKGLDPAPRDFHDAARMDVRSLYGLYNTISLGVGGTSMRGFKELSDADRWALAFTVAGLRAEPEQLARGERLWKQGVGRETFTDIHALVTATTQDERQRDDLDRAAVLAYLTAHPSAIKAAALSPIAVAKRRLQESLDAYRAGDPNTARQLAISAYLDGFELVESGLDNVDGPLRQQVEREMMALRSVITANAPADTVEARIGRISTLLDSADRKLSGGGLTATAAFVSSLLILLREGLEALLVLAAIMALVKKTGRRDAMRYIHAGWIGALALGAITWLVARYLLSISGASRELTEGFTALVAAIMLLYVGYWLHNRSNAKAWQSFIKQQVDSALAQSTLWTLAGISFLAVYRELFEMVLFYETLLGQAGPGGQHAVLCGIVAALVLLAVVGAAILRFSVKLPIGPFFTATAGLLALMAVIFVGNGVAALQEAGLIPATAVRFVSAPLLGIHPTVQTLLMQVLVLVLVLLGVWVGRRRMRAVVR
ncbi:MAG: FTR1 family protein [Flavobacteriales bacterium]